MSITACSSINWLNVSLTKSYFNLLLLANKAVIAFTQQTYQWQLFSSNLGTWDLKHYYYYYLQSKFPVFLRTYELGRSKYFGLLQFCHSAHRDFQMDHILISACSSQFSENCLHVFFMYSSSYLQLSTEGSVKGFFDSFLFPFRLLDVFFTSYVSLLFPLVKVHWPYRAVSSPSLKTLVTHLNSTDSSVSFVSFSIIML